MNRQIITAIKHANRQKHQILNESVSLSAGEETDSDEIQSLSEKLAATSPETDPVSMMLMKEVVDYLKANEQDIFSPFENKVWNEMLKGKTYREIAFRLRRPTKTVDNAMQRIKKKIQSYLEI